MSRLRPRSLLDRAPGGNPLPDGTLAVGAGLLVLGVTAYGFLSLSGQALGPERYSHLSLLWTLVFFAAPGFFFPLEQEVSRALSARRALGLGGAPVVRRAAILGGAFAFGLVLLCLLLARTIIDELFDGDVLLFASLLIGLPAYAAFHLTRGMLSGLGRFPAYGTLVALDGVLRLVGAVALLLIGFKIAGPYGLLIGVVPFVAIAIVLLRERDLLEPGPQAPWTELSGALGWLILGAVLAQGFVNVPVPLVKLLSEDGQEAIVGQFQAGLIVARVPLFLFQAIQAALLPKLAGLAAAGRFTDFRTGLKRLVLVVAGIGVVATIGGFAVGPLVLRLAFGASFNQLDRMDIGLMALASAAFMLSSALSQALIALGAHAKSALGWVAAIAVLAAVTALGDELLLRVELGLVAGSFVSVLAMAALLELAMRAGVPPTIEPVLDALAPDHEPLEP